MALERGQQKEAEALLAKAVETCPTNAEARRDYADSLWRRGMRPEAITQLEEAGRLTPDDAAIRVRLAEMHLAMGQTGAARAHADTAIHLNPKLPAAWAARGRVLRAVGDLRQALADYHRALGYTPSDPQLLLETAEIYRQMDKPQAALETLQSLADTYTPAEEPQHVFYLSGLAYLALRRYDDAAQCFVAAANRDRPTAEIFYRLAESQWLGGRAGEAAAAVQQALAIEPRHQPSLDLFRRIQAAQLAQQPQAPLRR
jgi:tetratricopeptide (TPR) repeat protein